jgi:ParB family chromosome partitioning protein
MAKAKSAASPAAATPAEATVNLVPLSDLWIHPLNVRSEPPPEDIVALADSIEAVGLLQNLAGFLDPTAPADIAWKIGIVAGGRRRRALSLLATRQGRDPAETRVPVMVTSREEVARLWASTENTARQALHPADEVRAYGRMAAAGGTATAIARAFAVTEAHVARRLKLAQLPEAAIDALRRGEISLDQAAALTVARSEEALLAELNTVRGKDGYGHSADAIRNRLTNETVSATDRRAVFVGVEAYCAAGGEVLQDLFTERTRLLDGALLDRLFAEKLQAAVASTLAEGWAWVKTFAEAWPDYNASSGMARVERHPVDLPEADADELDDLLRLGEQDELTNDQLARLDELEARAAGDYADEDIAASGLWLFVDRDGDLCTHGPYRPRAELAAADNASASAKAAESPALSASLTDDLRRIRLAALQLAVGEDYSLILDLLAWHLSGTTDPWSSPLGLSLTLAPIEPEKPDGLILPERLTERDRAPQRGAAEAAAFTAFRARPQDEKTRIVARSLARLITDQRAYLPALASLVLPDVRAIWTPTKEGYFSRCPVPVLDRIWKDLVPEDLQPPQRFAALKKAQKAQELHDLFNSAEYREALGLSRDQTAAIDAWLPAELQWPAIEGAEDPQEAEESEEAA